MTALTNVRSRPFDDGAEPPAERGKPINGEFDS
jgi:hypothetical protein